MFVCITSHNIFILFHANSFDMKAVSYSSLYPILFRIFYAMEFVGEIVCNIIGLNESKYQYVLDSMDENDWKIAKENEEKRTSEAQLRAIPV